jgi:hypothetical protein
MTPKESGRKKRLRQLRADIFPDVGDQELWERHNRTGFSTIPRALPIAMVLMDELSPKKPISRAYLSIWCRGWDDPFVELGSELLEVAMEAGFTGQRAVNSLYPRLQVLEQLGFVKFADGPGGKYAYALMMNPYLVLKQHQGKLSKMNWNALLARMNKIKADDFVPKPGAGATERKRDASNDSTVLNRRSKIVAGRRPVRRG